MRHLAYALVSTCLLLVLLPTLIAAQSSEENQLLEKKDPLFAAALSWYVPGAGLIYTDNWFRGILYFAGESVLLFYGLSSLARFQFDSLTFTFTISPPLISSDTNYFNITLWGAFYIGLQTISIIDSALSAIAYNEEHKTSVKVIPPSPFLSGFLSWLYPGLGQFYTRDYFTGSIFMFIDLAEKLVFLIATNMTFFSPNVTQDPLTFNFEWDKLSVTDKIFIISYVGVYFLNRILSGFFAYDYATKHLEDNSSQTQLADMNFIIMPNISLNSVGLTMYLKF